METVVALVVFALVATGLEAMLVTSITGQRNSLRYQKATAFAERTLEWARSQGWSQLVMQSSTLSGASTSCAALQAVAGNTYLHFFSPDSASNDPLPCEGVVESSAGTIPLTPPGVPTGYSATEYVTCVDQTNPSCQPTDLKRVTVHVTWSDKGAPKAYHATTLVYAYDVIPQPTRNVAVGGPVTAMAYPGSTGTQAVFKNLVTNTGTATDAFNVTVSGPSGTSWQTTLYQDANNNGAPNAYGLPTDPVLADTNGDLTPDTGQLQALVASPSNCTPGQSGTSCASVLLAVQVPAGTAAGQYTFTLTATSVHATSAKASVTDTLTVTSTATALAMALHNSSVQPASSSTTQAGMPMDLSAPTGSYTVSTVPDFSTDVKNNKVGRYQGSSGKGVQETNTGLMANWSYSGWSSATTLSGTITGTLWVQGCGGAASLVAYVAVTNGADATAAVADSGTLSVPAPSPGSDCTGQLATSLPFSITLPQPVTLGTGQYLELKVVASGKPVVLDYDGTGVQASVSLSQVAT